MSELADLHPDLQGLIGTVIHGRYRVDSVLGCGGMGAVFRAHHVGLNRAVALKVLHPRIGADPAVSKRFDREATSASRLDHPNCVRVTDFGTTDSGTKYLVMELLDGHELAAALGKPLPIVRAVAIARQILEGLEHAHHHGVVHRDLKPANIFVTTDFRGQELIKLVDFGIAKLIDEQGGDDKLTREGHVIGTPRYMSPEQASGGKMDERSDLYAVGLILYEMLAGKPPFVAEEPSDLLRMQILASPPPLPAGVPAELVRVVLKLLAKPKRERPANAREVLDALGQPDEGLPTLVERPPRRASERRLANAEPVPESRSPWLVAGLVLAATAAVGTGTAVVIWELGLWPVAGVAEPIDATTGTRGADETSSEIRSASESESETTESPIEPDLPDSEPRPEDAEKQREAERLRAEFEREEAKRREEMRRLEQMKHR